MYFQINNFKLWDQHWPLQKNLAYVSRPPHNRRSWAHFLLASALRFPAKHPQALEHFLRERCGASDPVSHAGSRPRTRGTAQVSAALCGPSTQGLAPPPPGTEDAAVPGTSQLRSRTFLCTPQTSAHPSFRAVCLPHLHSSRGLQGRVRGEHACCRGPPGRNGAQRS